MSHVPIISYPILCLQSWSLIFKDLVLFQEKREQRRAEGDERGGGRVWGRSRRVRKTEREREKTHQPVWMVWQQRNYSEREWVWITFCSILKYEFLFILQNMYRERERCIRRRLVTCFYSSWRMYLFNFLDHHMYDFNIQELLLCEDMHN